VSNLPRSVDVKSFIDQRHITSRQWLLVLLCFLIVAADGIDVAIMGFLAPSIIQEWGISRAGFGLVMSAAPVGLVIGALVAGPSSDRLGRKTVLMASVLAFGVCTVLTAFTHDISQMVVMRFLTGMFQTGGILGAVLTGWTMDRLKPSLVISVAYLGGAVCVLGVGSAGATASTLPLWMLAAGFFMNGAQTGLNAFAPACYPTIARATGVSWMQGMGRFGSILGSAVGGILLGMGWGFAGIVSTLAIPAGIAAFAMLASWAGGRRSQGETQSLAHS